MQDLQHVLFNGRVTVGSAQSISWMIINFRSGEQKSLLQFEGAMETKERDVTGQWVPGEPEQVTVKIWGAPERATTLIKEGVVLIIKGTYIEEPILDDDGCVMHINKTLTVGDWDQGQVGVDVVSLC